MLIKHARPVVDPATPSPEWKLSDQGREDARKLAEKMRPFGITQVVSSDEPKAMETAQEIASALGMSQSSAPDLHEHDRTNVPHMRSNEFISHMELFFRRPDERVLGREGASECLDRFEDAVDAVVRAHKDGNLAIVAHGTVISLYLAQLGAGKPFDLWRRMGLPSYAVIDWDMKKVLELVDRI